MKGTAAKVIEDRKDGEQRVRLVIAPGDGPPDQYSFTFLPEKDFAATDFDNTIVRGGNAGTRTDSWHADRLSQHDGFWVPSTATWKVADRDVENTSEVNFEAFSLTPPTDAEMKINFPVGTKVMDAINMQHYVVLGNGKRDYDSFYDVNTGKIILPTTQPTTGQ